MENNNNISASRLLVRVAELETRSGTGDFVKAIKIYEKVGN
jgi:hypothetical protein